MEIQLRMVLILPIQRTRGLCINDSHRFIDTIYIFFFILYYIDNPTDFQHI